MENALDIANLCRLCAEEEKNGIDIFENDETESELCANINKYLPLKIQNDDNLPKTICPGCNIQLESTVQFLNLIVKGQLIIRELLKEQQKNKNEEHFYVQVLEDGSYYAPDQAITLEIEGLTHPKRKRGRPKKVKPPTPPPEEQISDETEKSQECVALEASAENDNVEGRKRRRKTPQRFREAVQGKELERIFKEEGVIDEFEEEFDDKPETDLIVNKLKENYDDEIIGHMEIMEGDAQNKLIIINKAKGRGRPKGKSKTIKQTCNLCMLEFSSLGRYMAHIASYHSKDDLSLLNTENQQSTSLDTSKGDESEENIPNSFNTLYFKDKVSIDACDMSEMLQTTKTSSDTNVKSIISNDDLLMKPNASLENLPENILAGEESTQGESFYEIRVEKQPDSKFKCTECDKVFLSKQSCEVHLKAAHLKQRPFKCNLCDKSFPYQVTLKQHMLLHVSKGSRGYACDQCGKVLSHPSSVIYHKEAEHNNGRRFVCIKCKKSFKHKQLLQRHQLVHSDNRPYVCKICDASFKTKANLINHHPTHTGIKRFTCDICQHQFAHKASLTLHLRWHAGEKPFVCSVCSKRFSQNGNLAEHMRIHTGEKPYQCNMCEKAFTTSSQHKLHLQKHRGEKPWHCTECDKRFFNKETWKVHLRRHKGERPFSCDQCDRSFTERWALRKHQRMHSGERPYKCEICSRTFADCSNLTKHKKTHFPEMESFILPEFEMSKSSSMLPELNEDDLDGEKQHIVYVTYQEADDDENETPTFHIINENDIVGSSTDFHQHTAEAETYMINNEESMANEPDGIPMIFDQVTDSEGNPIHITTPDGTQLAITSTDGGKSLQVATEDGQLIPIQLGDKLGDEENILKDPLILSSGIVDEEVTSDNTIRVMGPEGQTIKFLATVDENNYSYYTFT